MSLHHVHVKVWKKNHPTAVMSATFVIGSFLIYQVGSSSLYLVLIQGSKHFQFGWFTMFFWGLFLPLLSVAAHAFLHVKGKTLIVKGPFWKKKKEIELEPNEAKNKKYITIIN